MELTLVDQMISMQREFTLSQLIDVLTWFREKSKDNAWLGYEIVRQTQGGFLFRVVFDPQIAAEHQTEWAEMLLLWNFVPRKVIILGVHCANCGHRAKTQPETCPVCHETNFVEDKEYEHQRLF